MSSYVRPAVADEVYLDADEEPIDYGNRWEHSPPEDTYSVVTHPERFAPLHAVADALIEHLRRAYDIKVVAEPGEERRKCVVPAAEEALSLTFEFTDHPGVRLHAGMHDFPYPVCGCDACDETWHDAADDLEEVVFAVAEGRYSEAITGSTSEPWIKYEIRDADGRFSRSGSGMADAGQLAHANPPPERYAPWPPRS